MGTHYTCRRVHLDQLIDSHDREVAAWAAEYTGQFTMRKVKIVEVTRYVVVTLDQYDPAQYDPYDTEEQAIEAAREVMTDPDSRGIYREWVVDEGQSMQPPIIGPWTPPTRD